MGYQGSVLLAITGYLVIYIITDSRKKSTRMIIVQGCTHPLSPPLSCQAVYQLCLISVILLLRLHRIVKP